MNIKFISNCHHHFYSFIYHECSDETILDAFFPRCCSLSHEFATILFPKEFKLTKLNEYTYLE